MSVTSKNNGYAALMRRVIGMKPVTIATGILERDGAAQKVAKAKDGNEASLIEVAVWNEFGTSDGHVPERSFIRAWFDANEDRLRRDLTVLMRSVVAGKRTREQILELIGQRCVGEIQQRIADGIPPENAASTVAQKGSSKPLIDTGQLRSSVSYEVKEG